MRGRPGKGTGHVEKLDGSAQAKRRLRIILETLSAQKTVQQACDELGVTERHFHRLREDALKGAIDKLEPSPSGRPHKEKLIEPSRVEELEREIQDLKIDLRAAQVREEIALVMPNLVKQRKETKKKRQRPP